MGDEEDVVGRKRGMGEEEALLARCTILCLTIPFHVPYLLTASLVAPRQKSVFSLSANFGSGCASSGSYFTLST